MKTDMGKYKFKIIYKPGYMSGYIHKRSRDAFGSYQSAMAAAVSSVESLFDLECLLSVEVYKCEENE